MYPFSQKKHKTNLVLSIKLTKTGGWDDSGGGELVEDWQAHRVKHTNVVARLREATGPYTAPNPVTHFHSLEIILSKKAKDTENRTVCCVL